MLWAGWAYCWRSRELGASRNDSTLNDVIGNPVARLPDGGETRRDIGVEFPCREGARQNVCGGGSVGQPGRGEKSPTET